MNPDLEIQRLRDMMPASGRMLSKIMSRPEQRQVIQAPFPPPWNWERSIWINFDLWGELTRPQRDLLILRTVSWQTEVKWFKPGWYQGLVVAGIAGTLVELVQREMVGAVAAGTLTAIAFWQIVRANRSAELELQADTAALQVAQRRGYPEAEAAKHLLGAIEAVARIEGRTGLDFIELLRCQNLRSIAGLSSVGVPKSLRSLE